MPGGLADPGVALVDPACGPGAFLAAALAVAGRRRPSPAACLGLDLDGAALAVARRALRPAAAEAGWPLALRRVDTLATLAPFGRRVPAPTIVVLGNPPWAGRSANRAARVTSALLDDFRRDGRGAPLGERKIGVLSDDYVRFYRWAAEVVRRAPGGGVVALVTNGSFLDGPVHRGMRGALLRWFDGIDVLDLGGSALVAGDGRRDDNVFGVRPAVAVTVAWRCGGSAESASCAVRYTALRGSLGDKLERLARGDTLGWRGLRSAAPRHLFVPAPAPRRSRVEHVALDVLVPFHREGVQTNRDAVAIDTDRARLLARLEAFARGSRAAQLGPARTALPHYDPKRARRAVAEALVREGADAVRPIAYRPFDDRWLAPIAPLCHRPRPALLAAIDRSSLVVLTVRKDRGRLPWSHFGATRHAPDNCWLSTRSSCRTRAFPTHGPDGAPNLDDTVSARWADRLGVRIRSEDVLCYVLAVLASPTYRHVHDAVLRLDYPPIPVPRDAVAFGSAVAAGHVLARVLCELGPKGRGPGAKDRAASARLRVGHVTLASPASALTEAIAAADDAVRTLLR